MSQLRSVKKKRANRSSCKGNNSGKVITKTPYVGEDNSPSKGKSKQGSWKRKDGRPVEGTLSCCMDINVGQKCKKSLRVLMVLNWVRREERLVS